MDADIAKAVKDARVAAGLAFFCLVLLTFMLLIDGRRNRVMLQHVTSARGILDEFHMAVAYAAGQTESVGGDPGGAGDNCADCGGEPSADLESAPAAGEGQPEVVVASNETIVVSAADRAGGAGGPRGNG